MNHPSEIIPSQEFVNKSVVAEEQNPDFIRFQGSQSILNSGRFDLLFTTGNVISVKYQNISIHNLYSILRLT